MRNVLTERTKPEPLELRQILTAIAIDQARFSQLTDQQRARCEEARLCERRIDAMQNGLRSEAQIPASSQPRVKFEERAAIRVRLAENEKRLPSLKDELDAGEKELNSLSKALAKNHARRQAIEQAIDTERKSRISDVVRSAAEAAPSRPAYLAARARHFGLISKVTAVEREQGALATTPRALLNEEQRATEFLASGQIPPEVPPIPNQMKELSDNLRTMKAALRMHEKQQLRKLEGQYGTEVAAALKPAQAALVDTIYTAMTAARNASYEADTLRVAFAVNCGSTDWLPNIACPGLATFPYQEDVFQMYCTSMRTAGFLA
jgi:hypothetical protein